MVRSVVLLMTAVLVVSAVAVPAAALAQPAPAVDTQAQTETESASDIAPGERLSGVVGVTEAEVDGEIEERTFGVRIANAATNESKADVVAEQVGDIERRLRELQNRKDRLEAARENGSISEGEYRAGMASTVARINTLERLANASDRTARSLPADVLEDRGVNTTAIQTLRNRADEMSGPEVAEVARSIAGPDAGKGIAGERAPGQPGPPEDRGPGNETDAGNGSDRGPPDDAGPDSEDGEGEQGDHTTAEEGGSDRSQGDDGARGNSGQ